MDINITRRTRIRENNRQMRELKSLNLTHHSDLNIEIKILNLKLNSLSKEMDKFRNNKMSDEKELILKLNRMQECVISLCKELEMYRLKKIE